MANFMLTVFHHNQSWKENRSPWLQTGGREDLVRQGRKLPRLSLRFLWKAGHVSVKRVTQPKKFPGKVLEVLPGFFLLLMAKRMRNEKKKKMREGITNKKGQGRMTLEILSLSR